MSVLPEGYYANPKAAILCNPMDLSLDTHKDMILGTLDTTSTCLLSVTNGSDNIPVETPHFPS